MNDATQVLRRKRLLWGALALSLVANGFFVGIAAFGWFEGPRRGGPLRMEIDSVGKRLPEDYRTELREDMRELLPELRPHWRRLRELRGEIADLAAQPMPDRAAIDGRLAEIRSITTQTQTLVQSRIFDVALAFPPEVRAELAKKDEGERD
jgi:uncharacterized membrane protein